MVLVHQANRFEFPFTTTDVSVDQCLYVNLKPKLNMFIKKSDRVSSENSYRLIFKSLYDIF